ncbi:Eco57I restriction-modification methylase domain-containing protein [Pararhodospirillum photometricum]|uniref:Eco57I restriction-modification methylase domain-containing protein n=1 Tax=Pararhodospirillum photometricum TaxID=1084 RepID=UPI0002F71152|nr:Eco57I restriction-modification methylase domain-containing protein [Pararhodospirillum photometricum]
MSLERGAFFTKRAVVEFILDLVGYTTDHALEQRHVLEPAVGEGDFIVPLVERLLATAGSLSAEALAPLITGMELHGPTAALARQRVAAVLEVHGHPPGVARDLAGHWIREGDFLLEPLAGPFESVVGNPPYVRQERLDPQRLAAYRARYKTLYDRADLYVPFYERALSLLAPGGHLGFICADRWMKNRYGGPLRALVSRDYRLKVVVDMTDTDAFLAPVIAYPAVTILSRETPGPTRLAHRPAATPEVLRPLARALTAPTPRPPVQEVEESGRGKAPWILGHADQTALVRRLEAAFPPLEEAGVAVGIGVATGADAVFIAPYDSLDVEPACKLPLVMTRDLVEGRVAWRGLGVVNPFATGETLVPLAAYPRLAAYLERHRARLSARHVAKRQPAAWYRPIDRLHASLTTRPKLLIPDIKGSAHIVLEEGRYYPHHNLYHLTSDTWDLRALRTVLSAGIASLFVGAYSPRLRGDFLRFQAQYLRRIRLPRWESVDEALRRRLTEGDHEAVGAVYEMTRSERQVMGRLGRLASPDPS